MFSESDKKLILKVKEQIKEKVGLGVLENKIYFQEFLKESVSFPKMFLSGGAIASLFQNETPNDWDLFFKNEIEKTVFTKFLTNSSFFTPIEFFIDERYTDEEGIPVNALTIKDDQISFIKLYADKPEYVKSTFDFVHCTSHYDIFDDTLHISELQFKCMTQKILMRNTNEPIKKSRLEKFLNRGYKIAADQIFETVS